MPGKKRVDGSREDDLGQIRILLEDMRAQNTRTAEAVEAVGRQNGLDLRALEERLGGRLDILEVICRSHAAELRRLDGKVDKLVSLDARVTGLERRSL
jgi:hypothetical protein